jgi:hypothetical protein
MSLPVLKAIYSLVQQGASIAGKRPIATPSLADDAAEFKRLSDDLFSTDRQVANPTKGHVYEGPESVFRT